ncbi:helix-turn-helix transcriptional regulator [Methylobacterium sp. Leaf399]|uniref:helix-turn-helix transcriptional regulator n=1 Tax=Methylobacterium sp. Leaf399 TaxID=1736364 RepID=UPI0009E952A6|nr:helix-turn-helix transcriptional regulator [Methylobacterium sp. Leaf399]
MTSEPPNRIAEIRKKKGMTQQALADAVGAHWITISKLERGKLPLSFEWAEKLGSALGVGEFQVFKEVMSAKPVFIDGIITEGGRAHFYKDEAGKEDFDAIQVELDLGKRANTVWFEIDNDGFFPFFQTHDLIQVEWLTSRDSDLFINRLCLVDLRDSDKDTGDLRLGFIVNGTKKGFYNLNILSGAPIKDVQVNSGVAVVTMALFNPAVWRGKADNLEPIEPTT